MKSLLNLFFLTLITVTLISVVGIKAEAHPLPGGVNHNTYLRYDENSSEILLDYQLYMFFRDVETFYDNFDLDDNLITDQEEKDLFVSLISEKVYFEVNDSILRINAIQNFTNQRDVEDTIWTSVYFTLRFDATDILTQDEENTITFFNSYLIQSDQIQDWNLGFDDTYYFFEVEEIITEQQKTGTLSPNQNQEPTQENVFLNRDGLFETTKSTLQSYLETDSTQAFALGYLFILSFVFGVAHTFTPGHGKAVISAYMAAIHGTVRDAITIALSLTISHTGVVMAISLIFVIFREAVKISLPFIDINITLPAIDISAFVPYLPFISGISIIGIGIYMLVKRIRTYIRNKVKSELHKHSHEHGDHDHEHKHHSHSHDHDHNHSHGHGHSHSHVPDHKLTLKEGISLGVTTGFNPCVDAITLLIISINLGAAVLGFGLLVAFSSGMALTLIGMGWGIGKGIRLGTSKVAMGPQILDILPIISSIFIIITGAFLIL